MFSREDSKRLRQEFWTSFGKSYPRKWILYDTKTKGLSLKFHFNIKKAMVSLDIELPDLEERIDLWEKLSSLKYIVIEEYLPDAIFEDSYVLENEKEISRLYVEKTNVSVHNKNTWQEAMSFLNTNMKKLETFYIEYRAILTA
ncbi:MAG: DUF4268 domain-containing protein [Maribacter sp.]|nr:DUF4268 domain-containing protein [Maribacter sp.]NNK18163.1 DUF4268 domain-containing protein [Maribacter sp.]